MLQKLVTRVGTNLGRASYALTARRLSAPKRPTPYALPREGLAPSKEAGDAVIKVLNDFTPLGNAVSDARFLALARACRWPSVLLAGSPLER